MTGTMLFDIFFLTVLFAYLGAAVLLFWGTLKSIQIPSEDLASPRALPALSILLAARNEEARLPTCLAALLDLDYPREKIEFLIVNDRSTDRTQEIAEMFAQHDERLRVLALTRCLPGMSGKASALCQGMQHTRGEIVLLTDADCIVPPYWARALSAHFTHDVGLVGGFTLLSPSPALRQFVPVTHCDHLFAKVQTLDWIYLLTVGAGAAGIGKPISILGNNFGFRRAAYEQAGGYKNLDFSIIEDFALMQKIVRETKWRVRFALSSEAALFSFPPQTWREFLEQRKRWAAGGREVGGFAKLLMLLAFLAHVAVLPALFMNLNLAMLAPAIMLIADGLLLGRGLTALRYTTLLKYFFLFEIYFMIYSIVLATTFFFPAAVQWKGRRYRWSLWGRIKSMEE